MKFEDIRKLCEHHDGDEDDWLCAWLDVGPKLLAVAEAAGRLLTYQAFNMDGKPSKVERELFLALKALKNYPRGE